MLSSEWLFEVACNQVAQNHTKNNDSPEQTLNRLFEKNLGGRSASPLPRITRSTAKCELQDWMNGEVYRHVNPAGLEHGGGAAQPVVVVRFGELLGVLDGNSRTRWRERAGDSGPHAVIVIDVPVAAG